MLLHDSYFHSSNKSFNSTRYTTITIAYSPLFHSTLTLIISIFGLLFNLICCIKIWFIIYQYRQRKLKKSSNKQHEQEKQESIHILSHNKYRFLLILTSNDLLLCLSSIISCLDEKYFFQAFLARHHLCAAHILIWKFTLHFIPLLIIVILYRYHFILNKNFQTRSSNLSTLNQLLCTDLSILIPFVLALAWSVDGLWLWGVANIKDYIMPPSSSSIDDHKYQNETTQAVTTSSSSLINNNLLNTSLTHLNISLLTTDEQNNNLFHLPEQTTICHLLTNHNFNFTVRLVHLIQADFLLLFSLHLIGLILEILLHIRLCCCTIMKKLPTALNHERQICMYILYIFIILTLTSLPFYIYRTIEIIFDTSLTSINNDFINSRTFAQILLFGACFKPLLFIILFFPPSFVFKSEFYLKCYSSADKQIINDNQNQQEQQLITHLPNHSHHRFSLFTPSTFYPKFHSKFRTRSNPILPTNKNSRQNSVSQTDQYNSWLKLTNSIIIDNNNEASNIVCV